MDESLTKFLFLSEDSDQLLDKRISNIINYEEINSKMEKVITKRIHNTLQISPNLKESLGKKQNINQIQYSNKHCTLFYSINNTLHYKFIYDLDADLKNGKFMENSTELNVGGQLFLSPNQDILAVLSQEKIVFVNIQDISNLKIMNELKNNDKITNIIWQTNQFINGWQHNGKAFRIHVLTKQSQQFQNIAKCTYIGAINKCSVIIQNITVSIFRNFKFFKKISLQNNQNPDSYLFEYCSIIWIHKINNSNFNDFRSDDIYSVISVYYLDEDQPDQLSHRYLNFIKGDLMDEASLKIRNNQLLYSSKDQQSQLYYDSQKNKLKFSIKSVECGRFLIFQVQKNEIIFAIDKQLQFEKLSLFNFDDKYDLKSKKFFKGLAIIKNLLPSEQTPPINNQFQIEIFKQYNGYIMDLYFAKQQTQYLVNHPPSIIAINQQNLFRRYAISMYNNVEANSKQYKSQLVQLHKKTIIKQINQQAKNQYSKIKSKLPKINQSEKVKEMVSKFNIQKEKVQQTNKDQIKKKNPFALSVQQNNLPKFNIFSKTKLKQDPIVSNQKIEILQIKQGISFPQNPKVTDEKLKNQNSSNKNLLLNNQKQKIQNTPLFPFHVEKQKNQSNIFNFTTKPTQQSTKTQNKPFSFDYTNSNQQSKFKSPGPFSGKPYDQKKISQISYQQLNQNTKQMKSVKKNQNKRDDKEKNNQDLQKNNQGFKKIQSQIQDQQQNIEQKFKSQNSRNEQIQSLKKISKLIIQFKENDPWQILKKCKNCLIQQKQSLSIQDQSKDWLKRKQMLKNYINQYQRQKNRKNSKKINNQQIIQRQLLQIDFITHKFIYYINALHQESLVKVIPKRLSLICQRIFKDLNRKQQQLFQRAQNVCNKNNQLKKLKEKKNKSNKIFRFEIDEQDDQQEKTQNVYTDFSNLKPIIIRYSLKQPIFQLAALQKQQSPAIEQNKNPIDSKNKSLKASKKILIPAFNQDKKDESTFKKTESVNVSSSQGQYAQSQITLNKKNSSIPIQFNVFQKNPKQTKQENKSIFTKKSQITTLIGKTNKLPQTQKNTIDVSKKQIQNKSNQPINIIPNVDTKKQLLKSNTSSLFTILPKSQQNQKSSNTQNKQKKQSIGIIFGGNIQNKQKKQSIGSIFGGNIQKKQKKQSIGSGNTQNKQKKQSIGGMFGSLNISFGSQTKQKKLQPIIQNKKQQQAPLDLSESQVFDDIQAAVANYPAPNSNTVQSPSQPIQNISPNQFNQFPNSTNNSFNNNQWQQGNITYSQPLFGGHNKFMAQNNEQYKNQAFNPNQMAFQPPSQTQQKSFSNFLPSNSPWLPNSNNIFQKGGNQTMSNMSMTNPLHALHQSVNPSVAPMFTNYQSIPPGVNPNDFKPRK